MPPGSRPHPPRLTAAGVREPTDDIAQSAAAHEPSEQAPEPATLASRNTLDEVVEPAHPASIRRLIFLVWCLTTVRLFVPEAGGRRALSRERLRHLPYGVTGGTFRGGAPDYENASAVIPISSGSRTRQNRPPSSET